MAYRPLAFLGVGWRHRRLIVRLARRRIESSYRGSVLGLLWTVVHPLLLLAIYSFVFSVVFQAKWHLPLGEDSNFALFLFPGVILYAIFAECVNEAPRLMLDHQTYIKQLHFPIEIFSWVSVVSSLFRFTVSFLLLIGFHLLVRGLPPVTCLYLPLVLCPLLLLTLGMSWLLSSLGTFLRDLSQLVGVFTTALLFLSPIFYPAESIPDPLRGWYALNPLAPLLEMARGVLLHGQQPDWRVLGLLTAAGLVTAWGGHVWFIKTKRAFADVL